MRAIFFAVFVLLFVGCSKSSSPSEEQDREMIAGQLHEIEAMVNEGHAAEKSSSLYLNYFAVDPNVLPYGSQLLSGKAEVLDFYTKVFSIGTVVSNSYTEPTIEVAGEFAIRTYEGTAQIQLSESNDLISFTNVYTDVLVSENGEWKILWHSWVPAPAKE